MPPKGKRKKDVTTHAPADTQSVEEPGKKRPDRAVKKAKRSEESETVVKACLRRHVRGDDEQKDDMCDAIRGRVMSFSKRVRSASLGITHLVKQMFDGIQDVASMQVPSKFFEQTFIRQLMLGTQDAIVPDADVTTLHQNFPEYLTHRERHRGDRNIYSAGATKYLTNLKNHMRVNLDRFMKRSIYALYPDLSKARKWEMTKRIKNERDDDYGEETDDDDDEDPEGDDEFQEAIEAHRVALGLVLPKDRVSQGWLRTDACLPRILRYYVFLNRQIERRTATLPPEERPGILKRLFDVVPICKIKTHFITIDTSALYGLVADLGYVMPSNYAAFEAMRDDHWRSVFKTSRLEGKNAKFTNTIETDGTSVCIHFVREKEHFTSSVDEPFRVREDDFVIACDPGGVDIMAMAVPVHSHRGAQDLNGEDMRLKTFSRSRYYRESGIIAARKHSNHWNRSVKVELEALSTVSSRGADFASFRGFMAVHVTHEFYLWREYTKPRWARQRLRLYGGKKRSFDGFFKELEDMRVDKSRRMVVAYGAGRSVATKGSTPAPSTRAFNECKKCFTTIPVDEFRTTYTHHEFGCVLARVEKRRRPRTRMQEYAYGQETNRQLVRRSKVRGLLWCDSTSNRARKHFVNRDFNAAINIRKCLILPERPVALCRSNFRGQRLVHRVGRVLKR